MAISGVGQSYYQNNVATTKSTKSVNSTGETGNTKELSEAEEMAIFKKEFYAEIDKIPRNRTITNVAINISEEAFKNMKDDPEYREKILSALKRDLTSSFAPLEASMVLTVGATAKDYRGDSWSGVNNQSEFYARSQNSFYKKTSNKKDRQKELLEEYLEKRAQVKKQQQEMLNEKIAKQAGKTINTLKQEYSEYESENYRIVPDNEAECFDIYNKDGERLGAFSYSDIKTAVTHRIMKQIVKRIVQIQKTAT